MLSRVNAWVLARPRALVLAAAAVLSAGVAWLDYAASEDVSLSLFYLVPVALAAWYLGRAAGVFLAVLTSGLWLLSFLLSHPAPSRPAIAFWNASLELGIFLTVALSLDALRRAFDELRAVANVDPLTGIPNRRAFVARLEMEARRPRAPEGGALTLLYIDLDGFKAVNDAGGHEAGDEVLVTVATTMRTALRSTDVTARLGGDEFAALLPDTPAPAARHVVEKLQEELAGAMRRRGMPVTFSIGAVAFLGAPPPVAAMLREADAEMYAVKSGGKNAIRMKVRGSGA